MADLHRALTNNPFDWYPSNIPVGKDKMPLDPSFVPRSSDQIKVSFNVEVEGRDKEISFYVTPFNNENVEDFLAQTWDQYKKSTTAKLPSALREDGPTHFRLFPLVLGVTATTSWLKVLEENCVNAADEAEGTNDTSYPNFINCVSLFLEEIAGIKYIGDALIRWLRHAKKPMAMAPEVCFRRRATILAYLDGGLLRSKLSRPSAYELAEAVFLAFPRSYQEKYAETHDELDEDVAPLRSAFMQYHAADVRNGTLAKLQKDKAGSKRPAERSDNRSGKKGRRPDKYSSGRGRRGDRRDRDGYDRGYDRNDRDRYRDDRDRHRTDDRGGRGGNHRPPKSGFVTPTDKKKGSGRGDHAHHIDDGSRPGDSRSSRSPSRARSRSHSVRDEEEAYHMAVARDHRDPQAPIEELEYDEDESARHQEYFDSRRPRSGWKSFFNKNKKSSASEPR